jgi:hypothetical protein
MPVVSDPLLPAVEHLLGAGAGSLLRTVVEAGGGTLVGYARRQVLYRPGDRAAVRYAVRVRWGSGRPVEETVVAVSTVDGPPEGTLVLTAGAATVGLFRYPHDPALPGLPVATYADRIEAWLRFGAVPMLRVRSYRPTRRAVVHARWAIAEGPEIERYIKCVPPADAGRFRRSLAELRGSIPVPVVAAEQAGLGMFALEALPGRTIRDVLLTGTPVDIEALPDGRAIVELLDLLPRPLTTMARPRPAPIERAAGHGALLVSILPRVARRVHELLATLDRVTLDGPEVLVHGDLYDAQILVDRDGVSGLLDLDDAGRGRRVDDLATFLGHLEALAEAVPARGPAIGRYAARVRPAFDAAVGPAALAASTAAVLVGLATGPFRVQQRGWASRVERRVGLAERNAARLRGFSPATHRSLRARCDKESAHGDVTREAPAPTCIARY